MSSRQLHSFSGGIRTASHKVETSRLSSEALALPERLYIPLKQHIGVPATPVVRAGQRVLKGDPIAEPRAYVSMAIHAPTSGMVVGIDDRPVAHRGGLSAPCIVLEPDGEDRRAEFRRLPDFEHTSPEQIQEVIAGAGIIGLGGAGFPSHVKMGEGTRHAVELLVINGVECEPYITCDDRLVQEHASKVAQGARIIAHAIQARHCILAVEDDMPQAYEALKPHCDERLELVSVPAIYPAGSEKQLIKTLTGNEVPSGSLPIQLGIVVQNVATAAAVYRAVVNGEPLIGRYVTVAGRVRKPINLRVLFGTPVECLLDHCGRPDGSDTRLLMGGPMMGIGLHSEAVPVTKTSNCILVLDNPALERGLEMPCIRCGDCIPVCPAGLQPQALLEFSRASDLDAAQEYHLFDCIECGCCEHVCPSHIPLVHYYRYAKSSIEALDDKRGQADVARQRFELRKRRLSRRIVDDAAPGTALADTDRYARAELADHIQAALARSKARSLPDAEQPDGD